MTGLEFFDSFALLDIELSQKLAGPYHSFSDVLLRLASTLGNGALLWLLLALALFFRKKTRWAAVSILIALILNFLLVNLSLKPLFDRDRPCFLENWCPKDPSFPSGHSSSSFAAASAVWFLKDIKLVGLALLMFFFAASIAYSRVFLGVHYLSDCLFGIFIGFICGYWASWLVQFIKANRANHAAS